MKVNGLSALLILLSLLSVISCKTGAGSKSKVADQSYLYTDIKLDEFYPAAQVELQMKSGGSTIYGLAYTANGKGPHPTVVLMHGLPGNERGIDVAQNLRRGGYNVIYFDYRGSWGSKGKFSFENSIEDVSSVIDHITGSDMIENLKVDPERIYLAGHSMGAGLAIIAGTKEPRVKAIFGASVFNPYTLFKGKEARSAVLNIKEYLATLGMLNTSPGQFMGGIMEHIEDYDIESMIAKTRKPILVIDEHMNNTGFAKYNKLPLFEYKIWNTDHAFTNRRVMLTSTLKSWLDDVNGGVRH